jgi:hypothetical protein
VTGKRHDYQVSVTWTGNLGEGTASHTAYSRNHDVTGGAKPTIPGTADPAFRGDPTRWNPEELLVASLSRSAIAFIELVTVADDRHGGPVGAEATLVPLQAPPEILDRLTETSSKLRIAYRRHSRDSRVCRFSSLVQPTLTPRWRGSRPLESLPAA